MIPIGEAIGQVIKCPCGFCAGAPARVSAGRIRSLRRVDGQISVEPSNWVQAECRIGRKMYRKDTLVEVLDEPVPERPVRPAQTALDQILEQQARVTISPREGRRGRE